MAWREAVGMGRVVAVAVEVRVGSAATMVRTVGVSWAAASEEPAAAGVPTVAARGVARRAGAGVGVPGAAVRAEELAEVARAAARG